MHRQALRFILIGGAVGLAIPFVFRIASAVLATHAGTPAVALIAFDNIQLMLWPTPILMVPTEEPGAPDLSSWGIFTIATMANITLYAVLAGLTWAGLAKSRLILAVPLLIVVGVWYSVWRI